MPDEPRLYPVLGWLDHSGRMHYEELPRLSTGGVDLATAAETLKTKACLAVEDGDSVGAMVLTSAAMYYIREAKRIGALRRHDDLVDAVAWTSKLLTKSMSITMMGPLDDEAELDAELETLKPSVLAEPEAPPLMFAPMAAPGVRGIWPSELRDPEDLRSLADIVRKDDARGPINAFCECPAGDRTPDGPGHAEDCGRRHGEGGSL